MAQRSAKGLRARCISPEQNTTHGMETTVLMEQMLAVISDAAVTGASC